MSVNESSPIIRSYPQYVTNPIVDASLGGIQQKLDAMHNDFVQIDYQEGCTDKIVKVGQWGLFGTGGIAIVCTGVEWYFRRTITLNPMTVLIGLSSLAALACLASCCLSRKASIKQSKAEAEIRRLKDLHLEPLIRAVNDFANKTKEFQDTHSSTLAANKKYAENLDRTIEGAGEIVAELGQTVVDIRQLTRELNDNSGNLQEKTTSLKQEAKDQDNIRKEYLALIAQENAKKNNPKTYTV